MPRRSRDRGDEPPAAGISCAPFTASAAVCAAARCHLMDAGSIEALDHGFDDAAMQVCRLPQRAAPADLYACRAPRRRSVITERGRRAYRDPPGFCRDAHAHRPPHPPDRGVAGATITVAPRRDHLHLRTRMGSDATRPTRTFCIARLLDHDRLAEVDALDLRSLRLLYAERRRPGRARCRFSTTRRQQIADGMTGDERTRSSAAAISTERLSSGDHLLRSATDAALQRMADPRRTRPALSTHYGASRDPAAERTLPKLLDQVRRDAIRPTSPTPLLYGAGRAASDRCAHRRHGGGPAMMSDERKRARADERAAVQAALREVYIERVLDTMPPPGPQTIAFLERLLNPNPRPFPGGQMLPQHPEHPVTPAPPPRHDHRLLPACCLLRGHAEADGRQASRSAAADRAAADHGRT